MIMAFKAPAKTTSPIKHIPPHNLEAEAAVLGSILINPEIADAKLGNKKNEDLWQTFVTLSTR